MGWADSSVGCFDEPQGQTQQVPNDRLLLQAPGTLLLLPTVHARTCTGQCCVWRCVPAHRKPKTGKKGGVNNEQHQHGERESVRFGD
jgi:hypothetical protein